jgi:hypothetical protein
LHDELKLKAELQSDHFDILVTRSVRSVWNGAITQIDKRCETANAGQLTLRHFDADNRLPRPMVRNDSFDARKLKKRKISELNHSDPCRNSVETQTVQWMTSLMIILIRVEPVELCCRYRTAARVHSFQQKAHWPGMRRLRRPSCD